jgi:tetratricopeptide (TPR) repeat protein
MDKHATSTGETPAAATSAVRAARWWLVPVLAFAAGAAGGIVYFLQQNQSFSMHSVSAGWLSHAGETHAGHDGEHSAHTDETPHPTTHASTPAAEPAIPIDSADVIPLSEDITPPVEEESADSHFSDEPAEMPSSVAHEPVGQEHVPHEPIGHEPVPLASPRGEEPPADSDRMSASDRLIRADGLFLEGSYGRARDEFAMLAAKAQGLHAARLRLRLALCHEFLGNHNLAQAEYQRVIDSQPGPSLQELALLGQARIWKQTGRAELASGILQQALIEGACPVSSESGSQIPHQLALLTAQFIRPAGPGTTNAKDPLSDAVLLEPDPQLEPRSMLAAIDVSPGHSSGRTTDVTEELAVIQRFSTSPEEIFLTVRTPSARAVELVRRICNKSGWEVRLTEEARLRLQERTIRPGATNLSLALMLDAILSPFELIWETRENAILILPANQAEAEQMSRYRIVSASRALRFASTFSPHHPWVVASSLELGRVEAYRGDLEAGIRNIRGAIERYPRADSLAIGWFNLGKLELRSGRQERAMEAFYHAVDLLSAHTLEPVGYLYLGRLQLEQNLPREAISPLTRALVLSEGTAFESTAALQLSSAYLMLQHYQRANEILMEHRRCFKAPAAHDQAAFLGSLIRYRAATDESDRFREGATLIGTLTNLKVESCFGGHWGYLAGLAYRDVGMRSQELQTFKTCLSGPYEFPLQEQLRLILLEDAPSQTPLRVSGTGAGEVSHEAFHAKAVVVEAEDRFRNGSHEEALKMCRQLLQRPQVPDHLRREALRLMGRIYQSQGEHNLAVECFTGVIPAPSSQDRESSAGHLPLGEVQ